MKRRFGNRHITVETQEMLVSDLSPSTRFQTREHDNAKVRGDEIARACLADGRTDFANNIVVYQEDGVNYIPAGLGRRCGAIKLGWERLNVDIVKGPNALRNAQYISLTDNNKQLTQRGHTLKEHAANAHRLHHEHGLSYKEIAELQGCSEDAARARVTRGGGLLVKLEGQKKPGAIKWFQSDRDAQGGALKAFRSLLCWECATYKDLTEKLSESYNVVLRVLVGDNEKQIAQVALDMLDNECNGKPTNFLLLFYLSMSCKTGGTGAAHRAVSRVTEHMAAGRRLHGVGTWLAKDLSNNGLFFDGEAVGNFLEACRKPLKIRA
jgi:hypothetical protein